MISLTFHHDLTLSDFPVRSLPFPFGFLYTLHSGVRFWFWFLCIFPLSLLWFCFYGVLAFPCNSHFSNLYPKLSCSCLSSIFVFHDLRQTLLRMKCFACELAFFPSLFCFTDRIYIYGSFGLGSIWHKACMHSVKQNILMSSRSAFFWISSISSRIHLPLSKSAFRIFVP
jgi:hypothetical protein